MAQREVSPLRGWLMLGAGLFLIGLMGTITLNMWPTLTHPGVEIEGTTFTGTVEQADMILGLFALVILFGIASAVNGALVLVTGRQSATLRALALGLATILFAIGWAVRRGWFG